MDSLIMNVFKNPEKDPLYFNRKYQELLKPCMENMGFPLWKKHILIYLASRVSPTYLDMDCKKIQSTPGRSRSIDDIVRIFHGLNCKVTTKEFFKYISIWNNSFINVGYCSTIRRNKVDISARSICFDIHNGNYEITTNLRDWLSFNCVLDKNYEKYLGKVPTSWPTFRTCVDYLINVIINNKIYIRNKRKITNKEDGNRYKIGHNFFGSTLLQKGYLNFSTWKHLDKNVEINYIDEEQITI